MDGVDAGHGVVDQRWPRTRSAHTTTKPASRSRGISALCVESGAADDSDTADKTVQSIVIEADAKAVAAVVVAQSQTAGTIMGDGAPLQLD